MQVLAANFNGYPIRYIALPENGLLINTKDYCRIASIADRPSGDVLAEPCIDLTSAVSFAGNTDFAMWLIGTFARYDLETLIHPICDDEWSSLNSEGQRHLQLMVMTI